MMLVLIMFIMVLVPVQNAGDIPLPPADKATIGTFWWYRDNGGLLYAQGDAQGFASALEDDGCDWPIDKNDIDNELYDDYLEDDTGELIDDVDIAYFVGHSDSGNLGIGAGIGTNKYAEWDECQWGDDGPLKWVALATCLAGKDKFSYALNGAHLILGWETIMSDALYGPTFANYIKEGYTLKEAWFLTGEECEHVHGVAKILGEDTSVGDDHLKGYGSYAIPSPTVDDDYSWWTHEVLGWQENYNFIQPDDHEDPTSWDDPGDAYNGEYLDYTDYPSYNQNYAVFNQVQNDWSDPIILTLDAPVTIQGFRTIAGKGDHIDEMKVKFYLDDDLKTIVYIDNWEKDFWRIIDFDATQYEASISGDLEPEVNRVEIQFHENAGLGFFLNPAELGEFDFWEAGEVSGSGVGYEGYGEETKDDPGEGVVGGILKEIVVSQGASQSMGMEIGMRSIGTTSKSSSEAKAYTSIPDEYNPDMFASIANKLEITKDNEKTLQYNEQKGVWKYVSPSEAYPTVNKKPILPSDGESVALAVAFMEENGFSTEDITDAVVTYQKQGAGVKGTEEVLYEWVITKNVNFKKEINGVLINEKNTITIGEGGTISAFNLPTNTIELI